MILVVGATGTLGGSIAHDLIAQGEPVRAMVREGSDYAALKRAGAEIVYGELTEPDTLGPAVAGMEKVVCTATAAGREGETFEEVDREGVGSLIDAAEEANVGRFLFVSAHGFPELDEIDLARAKAASEKKLRAADLDHVILAPCAFMEVWIGWVIGGQLAEGPSATIVGDGTEPIGFVSVEDVADLAVAALGREEAANTRIPLIADVTTFGGVIEEIEAATGMEIEVATVEPGETPPGMPPLIGDLWPGLLSLDYEVTHDTIEEYGLAGTGVDTFVGRAFGGPQ